MTEYYYAAASCLSIMLIIFIPVFLTKFKITISKGLKNWHVWAAVIIASTLPRIIFTYFTFELAPEWPDRHALHTNFKEHFWNSNFESSLMMLISYLTGFLSFGTNVYHPVVAGLVGILSTVVGVSILKKIKAPFWFVITVPVLLSWMRIYPELVWADHHDVYIIFFAMLFMSTFIDFANLQSKRNSYVLALTTTLTCLISPTNFVILLSLFIILIGISYYYRAAAFRKPAILITVLMTFLTAAQCTKTYLSSGIFAPTAVGSHLFGLNLYKHYATKSESDLEILLNQANAPYWYRRCMNISPSGKPENKLWTLIWHRAGGECFSQHNFDTSGCRGPNYEFTRTEIIDRNDTVMQDLISRDILRACEKPDLFLVGMPSIATEFGYEYQKISAKVIRTWLTTKPLSVIQNAFASNYPLFEIKGSALLTSNFFAPIILLAHAELAPIKLPFLVMANIVKIFCMILIILFHVTATLAIIALAVVSCRGTLRSHMAAISFANFAVGVMIVLPKILAIVIYCVVAGAEGERYWQQFSWNVAIIDVAFLVWLNQKLSQSPFFCSKTERKLRSGSYVQEL